MAIPVHECPVCHKPTLPAYNQRYCPACGWNVESALGAARQSMFMLPFGMLMFAGFVAFMIFRMRFHNKYQIAIFCVVPVIGILVNYISMRRTISRLQALPAAMRTPTGKIATTGGTTGNSGVRIFGDGRELTDRAVAAQEPSAEDQALLRTSCPRQIRMSGWGRFGVTGGVLFAGWLVVAIGIHLYGLWAPVRSFARFHTSDVITGAVGLLLAMVPYGIWRGQVKECDLLENGDIAMGVVTQQWTNEGNSSIQCEFKDSMGQTHMFSGPDNGKRLYQGMTVPVFYDRNSPSRCVAYCSTLHRVVV